MRGLLIFALTSLGMIGISWLAGNASSALLPIAIGFGVGVICVAFMAFTSIIEGERLHREAQREGDTILSIPPSRYEQEAPPAD